MGTGTDATIEASDLTLVRGDLRAVADAIRLSRRTLRTIEGNLFWAFGTTRLTAIRLLMAISVRSRAGLRGGCWRQRRVRPDLGGGSRCRNRSR